MNDVRSRAKTFYNALDLDRPIDFGVAGLVDNGLDEALYVKNIHGEGDRDLVAELAGHIDFSASAGAYLFTGNRGTGKTTELLRLAKLLKGYGCEVFYADMSEYLILTQRIEISDFLISVLGAFSEKIAARFGNAPGRLGFFERVRSFLNTNVTFEELSLPVGAAELKASLTQNPTFKEQLQIKTRGVVERLVKEARDFALEAVLQVRAQEADPDRKVVLIVDSVERLRGVGDAEDIGEVFKSAATLFSSHADKLRFTGLTVIYTIPPYLSALAGGLGAYYAGGRIYYPPERPHLRVPAGRRTGTGSVRCRDREDGRDRGPAIPRMAGFLRRGAASAARAELRRRSAGLLPHAAPEPRPGPRAAQAPRPGPDPDRCRGRGAQRHAAHRRRRPRLARTDQGNDPNLPSLDQLSELARLQQGKYVLQYRNGEDWYDVHPLLRRAVVPSGNGAPHG